MGWIKGRCSWRMFTEEDEKMDAMDGKWERRREERRGGLGEAKGERRDRENIGKR